MNEARVDFKVCTRCKETKVAKEFLRDKRMRCGLSSACRACLRAAHNAQREKNNARRKNYRRKNPEKWRRLQLKYNYGLAYEDYLLLSAKQNNACRICSSPGPLQVDHNHKTGQVRGLLCGRCNRDLGVIELHKGNLNVFLEYLEETDAISRHNRLCESPANSVAQN